VARVAMAERPRTQAEASALDQATAVARRSAEPDRRGLAALLLAAAVFTLLCLPVVIRGAPLADDFHNCVEPTRAGLNTFFAASTERLGAVRPARFVEILLTTGVCQQLPFGFAIAVPLALTLLVAALLRALLNDLDTPAPWPTVGAVLWLAQPLGTESALWPAALHVPLGLALALAALLLHRRGRHGWAAAATLGACLSAEQVILALPLAVWLTAPAPRRRRATVLTLLVVVGVLATYAVWSGADPRLQVPIGDRLRGVVADPAFYVLFPAVGLGVHSMPLAMRWAFPASVAVVAAATLLGWRIGPALSGPSQDRPAGRPALLGCTLLVLALIALINLPLILQVPRQGSPRTFTPTWLVLAAVAAAAGSRVRWRRPRLLGAALGLFVAGALLSLALSVSVRVHTADFNEKAVRLLAGRIPDGGVVAVCDVPRTAVTPAPRGAFAVHELVYDWAARDALYYYTGRNAEFRLAGPLWGTRCPDAAGADVVVDFEELRRTAEVSP
jgi:hypothetical protein